MLHWASAGLIAILLTAVQARALPPDCRSEQSQAALNICSYEEYKAADAELNAMYRLLREKLDGKAREFAARAEQAWITFRDAECLSRLGAREDSGTIYPLLFNVCMTRLTRERTKDLREQAKCPGTRLDCPG